MSLHSSGRPGTKFLTASGLLTSSCTGRTLTPSPTSAAMSAASDCSSSTRRAARMRRRLPLGQVRANSRAVDRPMPEEAPVMRTVLPARRWPAAESDEDDMVLEHGGAMNDWRAVRDSEKKGEASTLVLVQAAKHRGVGAVSVRRRSCRWQRRRRDCGGRRARIKYGVADPIGLLDFLYDPCPIACRRDGGLGRYRNDKGSCGKGGVRRELGASLCHRMSSARV